MKLGPELFELVEEPDVLLKCPICDKMSKVKEWDEHTLKNCEANELSNFVRVMSDDWQLISKSRVWSKCPECDGIPTIKDIREYNNIKLQESETHE